MSLGRGWGGARKEKTKGKGRYPEQAGADKAAREASSEWQSRRVWSPAGQGVRGAAGSSGMPDPGEG